MFYLQRVWQVHCQYTTGSLTKHPAYPVCCIAILTHRYCAFSDQTPVHSQDLSVQETLHLLLKSIQWFWNALPSTNTHRPSLPKVVSSIFFLVDTSVLTHPENRMFLSYGNKTVGSEIPINKILFGANWKLCTYSQISINRILCKYKGRLLQGRVTLPDVTVLGLPTGLLFSKLKDFFWILWSRKKVRQIT